VFVAEETKISGKKFPALFFRGQSANDASANVPNVSQVTRKASRMPCPYAPSIGRCRCLLRIRSDSERVSMCKELERLLQ
jgi:hypothetical protein